jgi:hypothetical protein
MEVHIMCEWHSVVKIWNVTYGAKRAYEVACRYEYW